VEEGAPPAPEAAEIPSWLQDMGPVEEVSEEAEEPEEPAIEGGPAAGTPPSEPSMDDLAEEEPADELDWLRELADEGEPTSAEEAAVSEPAAEPAPEAAEIPSWLQDMEPVEEVSEEAEEPEEPAIEGERAAESAQAFEPTGALEEKQREEEVEESTSPVQPFTDVPSSEEEPPEWLQEITAAEDAVEPLESEPLEEAAPSTFEREVETFDQTEDLARAEIPDWLEDLRPSTTEEKPEPEKEPIEEEGVLKGLRGVLPAAPAIEMPADHESTTAVQPGEPTLSRAKLLQSLLTQPAEKPSSQTHRKKHEVTESIQRWMVALVLLVVVGGALMAPMWIRDVPRLTRPVASPGVLKVYDQIQSLGPEDEVLVAFDYGPTEADELDIIARPILQHLLDRESHISVVTTRPEGLTMAVSMLSNLVAASDHYTDTQYTLQGYRPGGASGVSQLLSVSDRPTMLLLLTAQPKPLRQWVEQGYALYGDELSIVAGVSAALELPTSPYLEENAAQLKGSIRGLGEAAAYEDQLNSTISTPHRLNALVAGHIAIVGLIILGAIYGAISGQRRSGER
jgi:hypothetical protein